MTASRRTGSLVFVIAAVFVTYACGEIRPDEVECEEAVAHLVNCCPGLDARGFNCIYQEDCGETLFPSVSVTTAQCVRSASCDDLTSTGTCERAIKGNFLPDDERGPGSSFDDGLCQ